MNWQDVPVYICTHDRLSCTKKLVDWLLDAGTKQITIIDTQSTYSPLLNYFNELPKSVSLHSMGSNAGPWNSWHWANDRSETPYIFTDSDIIPANSCPKDLIKKCLDLLNTKECSAEISGKIGPSLRLDNIPEENLNRSDYFRGMSLKTHESEFWKYPDPKTNFEHFSAPIDTTFAIYGPHSIWSCDWRNIRLNAPYIIEHQPWYAVKPYSEEEAYYRNQKHCEGTAHFESIK